MGSSNLNVTNKTEIPAGVDRRSFQYTNALRLNVPVFRLVLHCRNSIQREMVQRIGERNTCSKFSNTLCKSRHLLLNHIQLG